MNIREIMYGTVVMTSLAVMTALVIGTLGNAVAVMVQR